MQPDDQIQPTDSAFLVVEKLKAKYKRLLNEKNELRTKYDQLEHDFMRLKRKLSKTLRRMR